MKMSDMPEGAVVRLFDGRKYLKGDFWISMGWGAETISLEDMDTRDDPQLFSLPVEVTLMLATWLDNTYTMSGNPDALVLDAIREVAKSKEEGYISTVPKKSQVGTWRVIPGFEQYEMNLSRDIADTLCGGAIVPLVEKEGLKGAQPSVLLRTEGGCGHMNVTYLFRQTFPELVVRKKG